MSSPPHDREALEDTVIRAPAEPSRPPKRRRRTGLVLGVLLGLLLVSVGALYAVGYLKAGDRLPKNASVAGVPVGGLDRDDAITKVSAAISPRADRPMTVAVADRTAQLRPAEAGLRVDVAASVDRAGGGRSFDPRQIWRVLTGGAATDAVVEVDQAKLSAAVAALAAQFDAQPADARLAFKSAKIVKTPAVLGVVVQQPEAAEAIEDAYLVSDAPVQLPAQVREPEITTAEVDALIQSFAKPAVSAPITVTVTGAGRFKITPEMIGRSITFQPTGGSLVPRLDPATLRKAADPAVQTVELTKPRDATVRLVNGRPRVIPAVNGTNVTAADLAKAVEPALTRRGDERRASVRLTGAKAKFTTADARKLGVKEVIGEFTTYYPHADYRNVNISRAASLINNTLLKPGEIFSLNGIVGERTRANGFVEGNIIQNGKFRMELGGGVSQSATTTFNAMFFAGLKDIQHQPHTLYIDRYPAGREATVAWPGLDLKFQNDTKYGVLVQAFVNRSTPGSRGSITVRMWSTKTYDRVESSPLRRSNYTSGRDIVDDDPDCQPMSPVQGFDVNYSRLFYNDGRLVKRENFFWRYAPTDRVRCR